MKKHIANRINALLKNVTNIQTLVGDLLMPIEALQQKYSCTQQEAVNIKIKAEEYLTQFGTFTLDTTVKGIKQIVQENIEET